MTTDTRMTAAAIKPARVLIERRHQFAFGKPDQIGAVDDIAEMALQIRSRARQARHFVRERDEVFHQHAAVVAIVRARCTSAAR